MQGNFKPLLKRKLRKAYRSNEHALNIHFSHGQTPTVALKDDDTSQPTLVIKDEAKEFCPICYEEYSEDPNTIFIGKMKSCGHYFHFYCLWEWLERNASCPLCRGTVCLSEADITGISLAQVKEQIENDSKKDSQDKAHIIGVHDQVSQSQGQGHQNEKQGHARQGQGHESSTIKQTVEQQELCLDCANVAMISTLDDFELHRLNHVGAPPAVNIERDLIIENLTESQAMGDLSGTQGISNPVFVADNYV